VASALCDALAPLQVSGVDVGTGVSMEKGASGQDNTKIFLMIVLGAIIFGALMGVRQEFSQGWARAVVSRIAGGVMGGVMGWVLSRRGKKRT
jgi:lipoprotein signal peptidase